MTTKITVERPGMLTTVQDYPGRTGYWQIGVPPSGPMDDLSFRLGNVALGNDEGAPTGSTGGAVSAEVWHRFMTEATEGMLPLPLPGVAEARAAQQNAATVPAAAAPSDADRNFLERLLSGI